MGEVENIKEKHAEIPRANRVKIDRQKTCNLSYRLFSFGCECSLWLAAVHGKDI